MNLVVQFRVGGSAAPRARAVNAIGVQVAAVDGATTEVKGEADGVPNQFVPRSPAYVDSTRMPPQVRLYARWITRRGETSPWSSPLTISVI